MLRFDTPGDAKGWYVGPWNSAVPVAIGYANEGVAVNHRHEQMNEVYMVARGSAVGIVDGQRVDLAAGDCLVVEPGEDHTFVSSSEDYLVFVVQTPFVKGDKVELDPPQA